MAVKQCLTGAMDKHHYPLITVDFYKTNRGKE